MLLLHHAVRSYAPSLSKCCCTNPDNLFLQERWTGGEFWQDLAIMSEADWLSRFSSGFADPEGGDGTTKTQRLCAAHCDRLQIDSFHMSKMNE